MFATDDPPASGRLIAVGLRFPDGVVTAIAASFGIDSDGYARAEFVDLTDDSRSRLITEISRGLGLPREAVARGEESKDGSAPYGRYG